MSDAHREAFAATAFAFSIRIAKLEEAVDALGHIVDLGADHQRQTLVVHIDTHVIGNGDFVVARRRIMDVFQNILVTGTTGRFDTQTQPARFLTQQLVTGLLFSAGRHGDAGRSGYISLYGSHSLLSFTPAWVKAG
mgnify:CR=1 FL=1